MNTNTFSVKSYYNENGLNDDGNLNYLLKNSSGAMIIGGHNMLNVFRPSDLVKNKRPPQGKEHKENRIGRKKR